MDAEAASALRLMDVVVLLAVGFLIFIAAMVVRVKSGGKYEIKPMDLVLVIVPLALWLFATGKITKFNVAGVEVELAQQFIKATENTITFSRLETPKIKVEDVARNVEKARKMGVDRLPELIKRKTEAIEFQLGHGGYWGPAIEKYFDTLSTAGLLRFVLIYDDNRKLYGVFDARALYLHLESQGEPGYEAFAQFLNKNDASSRMELSRLPGWVSVADSVTPDSNNRVALETMGRLNTDFLPVVDDKQNFIGIVERSKITARLVIDVTRAMEGINKAMTGNQ